MDTVLLSKVKKSSSGVDWEEGAVNDASIGDDGSDHAHEQVSTEDGNSEDKGENKGKERPCLPERPRLPVAQLERIQEEPAEFFFAVHVRVTGIDSMEQSIEVEGDVHLVWKVPKGGDADKLAKDLNSLGSSFDGAEARAVAKKTPVFFGPNLFSSTRDMAILAVDATATGSVVHVQVDFRGFIEQSFNYKWFPFDRHYLTLVLRLRSADEWIAVDAIPRSWTLSKEVSGRVGEIGGMSYSTGPRVTDWRFGPDMQGPRLFPKPYHVQRARKKGGEPESAVRQLGYPTVMIPVERRSSFYLYSFFMPLFAFVVMSFTAFLVTGDEMGGAPSLSDRLSITLSLLLSTVAFKFTVSEFIPVTSHTTLLDKYLLACLGTQSAVVVANAIIEIRWSGIDDDAGGDDDDRENADWALAYLLFYGWLLLNVVMVVVVRSQLWLPTWRDILQDALQWNRDSGKGGKRSTPAQSEGKQWVQHTHNALVALAESASRDKIMAKFKKGKPSDEQWHLAEKVLDLAWTATGGTGGVLFDEHLSEVTTSVGNRGRRTIKISRLLKTIGADSTSPDERGTDNTSVERDDKMTMRCDAVAVLLYNAAECFNNACPKSPESARRLCVLAEKYAQKDQPLYGDILQELAYAYRWLPGGGMPLLRHSETVYKSARDFSQFLADRALPASSNTAMKDADDVARGEFWALYNRRRVQTAKTNLQSVERRMFLLEDKDEGVTVDELADRVVNMLEEWQVQHKARVETGEKLMAMDLKCVEKWCKSFKVGHASKRTMDDAMYNADVAKSYDNRALIFDALLKSERFGMQRWARVEDEEKEGPALLERCQEKNVPDEARLGSPLKELLRARMKQREVAREGVDFKKAGELVAGVEASARGSIFEQLALEARRLLDLDEGETEVAVFPVSAMLELGARIMEKTGKLWAMAEEGERKDLPSGDGEATKEKKKKVAREKREKKETKQRRKTEEEKWQELQNCAEDLVIKVLELHIRAGVECDLSEEEMRVILNVKPAPDAKAILKNFDDMMKGREDYKTGFKLAALYKDAFALFESEEATSSAQGGDEEKRGAPASGATGRAQQVSGPSGGGVHEV